MVLRCDWLSVKWSVASLTRYKLVFSLAFCIQRGASARGKATAHRVSLLMMGQIKRQMNRLVFLFSVLTLVSTRIFNDSKIASKMPVELKTQIDNLLEEKIQLFLTTFFGENIERSDGSKQPEFFEEQDAAKENFDIPSTGINATEMNYVTFDHTKRIRRNLHSTNNSNASDPVVNGSYSNWSGFGPCSASCGGGTQQRRRHCNNPMPKHGGRNCSSLGTSVQTKHCNIFPCMAESYALRRFKPLSTIHLVNISEIKHFKIGNSDYLATLYPNYLQLYKWNETTLQFTSHGQRILVHKAYSLDFFSHVVDHYLVLAESIKLPFGHYDVTRVLSYNPDTETFDDRKHIKIPAGSLSRVAAFKIFGKPHAGFVSFESRSPGPSTTTTLCDKSSKIIKCVLGSTITIKSAFYGRASWSVCAHGWYFNIKPCSAPNALQIIAAACNNKTSCLLQAPLVGISDPCPVLTKYLTVDYTCDRKMLKTSPKFYVWEGSHFQLLPSNSLEVHGAKDICPFTIHHKHFVAVANYLNDQGSYHLDSEIFIYSPDVRTFKSFQKLRTDGACDWEFFSIGEGLATEYFLAVANHIVYDKNIDKFALAVDSVIYKWNWNVFVPFQCIKTTGAHKWTAITGSDGQFLLTLSSGSNKNITIFGYDGWRFYRYDQQPQFPAFVLLPYDTYTFNVNGRTMYLIESRGVEQSNRSNSQNLFEVDFVKAFPRFTLMNETLSKVSQMNRTLDNLVKRIEDLNDNFTANKHRMVLFNGTNNVTGYKHFSNVIVKNDVTANVTILNTVKLSPEDENIISRQNLLEEKLNTQEMQIKKLLEKSRKTLSKCEDQVINTEFNFEEETNIQNLKAKNINVSGTVNGVDLSLLAAKALFIDKDQVIRGNKTFAENVVFENSIRVGGQVDSVNISDAVLLNSEQVINGRKEFSRNLLFDSIDGKTKNIEIRGLLNGINVSNEELLTVEGEQIINGEYEFVKDVRAEKDLKVKLVNKVNLTKLYEDAVLVDADQNITGHKIFLKGVKVNGDLLMAQGKTVDNVDVSELNENYLSRTKDQNITKSMQFNGDVIFQDALQVNGLVNGINVSRDIVYLSKEQVITGGKHFLNDLTLHRNLEIDGLINGVNVSGDVMTVNTEQVITGRKTFDSKITIHGNIAMKENKTVDGVDVSELAKDAVYKNIPQNITGDKSFDALSVGNISISCKKACFFVELMNNLTKKTVKTDTSANITGLKTFSKKVFVSGKTIVDGYVNSMKVPYDLVLIDNPGVIHGKKTFKKVVDISGDLKIDGKMNDLNITDMYQNALHLDGAQTITGKKEFINGLSFGSNVNISGLLNGLKIPDDLVLVEADEEVSAHKIFKGILSVEKLAVDKMTVAGLIDGVNVTTLNRTIIKKVGNQVIPGDVTFKKGLTVRDNLVAGGNINGIDLKELDANAMKITGDQIVTGKKVFTGPVSVKDSLNVDGLVDNVNITDLAKNAVTLDGNQTISGQMSFKSNLTLAGNLQVNGFINKVNITRLTEDSLYTTGNQIVTGEFKFKNVSIKGDMKINGKVNGIDLSEEAVTLTGNETMLPKTFTDGIQIKGNLDLDGLIDSVNLTRLDQDSVRLHGLQVIQAKKTFTSDIFINGNMQVDGLVDGVNVTELNRSVLTKGTDQVINGSYFFKSNVTFLNSTKLSGEINGINLTEFSKNVVTTNTPQTIFGEKIFNNVSLGGLLAASNMNISGKINGVDLSELDQRAVKVNGRNEISGVKTFLQNATFENDMIVDKSINGIRIPDDIVRLSTNQVISGTKEFQQDFVINGDLDVEDGLKVDSVDISELAKNAVYQNGSQVISGPLHFKGFSASDMKVDGLINGVNVSRENLLLKSGKQTVAGRKTLKNLFVKGNLTVGSKIAGVDVVELNSSSVFVNRDNKITGEKEILGNFIIKGNLSVNKIDGVKMKDLQRHYTKTKTAVSEGIGKISSSIEKQEEALKQYLKATHTLRPRLDYFVKDQSIPLDENIVSFDAIQHGNTAILITANKLNDVNSTVYKRDTNLSQFIPNGQVALFSSSDLRVFKQDNKIHAAVANGFASTPSRDFSDVFTLKDLSNFSFIKDGSYPTRSAQFVEISKFGNESIITFSNKKNISSTNPSCLHVTPLLYTKTGILRPIVSIYGCSIQKVITHQIDSVNFLLASLSAGLYAGREAVLYRVNINGSYTVLQCLPTFYASDLLFVKANGELFLVIANEYQESEVKVPVQIYRYSKKTGFMVWYQELNVHGSLFLASFTIDRYVYVIIASNKQDTNIFQFMGAGKFSKIGSLSTNRMNSIKRMRTWTMDKEIFVGILSVTTLKIPQTTLTTLTIFRAVKTALLDASDVQQKITEAINVKI